MFFSASNRYSYEFAEIIDFIAVYVFIVCCVNIPGFIIYIIADIRQVYKGPNLNPFLSLDFIRITKNTCKLLTLTLSLSMVIEEK